MADEVTPQRFGREGARWINQRPSSEEFGEWFTKSVKVDPALKHEDYVGGIVLIPAVESKSKYVMGWNAKGNPIMGEREELAYIPYAKVETRISYFWDYLEVHPELVGIVEDVDVDRMPIDPIMVEESMNHETGLNETKYQRSGLAEMAYQLPIGFHVMSVPHDGKFVNFLCCTRSVSIYRTDENGEPKGKPVRYGRGTKMVAMLTGRATQTYNSIRPDENAIMKAETGALGRALGFAGILTIPGSGIATAEDILEATAGERAAATSPVVMATEGGQGPDAPDDVPPAQGPARTSVEAGIDDEQALKARGVELWKQLQEDKPGSVQEFGRWAKERGISNMSEATGPKLKGIVRKLEKLLDGDEPAPAEVDAPEPPAAPEAPDAPDAPEPPSVEVAPGVEVPVVDPPREADPEPAGPPVEREL